ncbi:MAG: OPT/YSL family transporter [Phycisphaerales bacterium]|nr:OPT/YSL family transporter [Phycisphaerales bacterium]
MTFASVLFAIVIGVVMNASITYAGLKIGFTIGGSAIAAVVGYGVLRGLLRTVIKDAGSVVEVNLAQTVASAVNTSNSGVIFTVPVLFLLGATLTWTDTDFWLITVACIAGGVLGTAFIIPLRKQMIEIDRLRFPSAVGVATILKSPGGGVKKTLVLLAGILAAMAVYAPTTLPALRLGRVQADGIRGEHQRPLKELLAAAETPAPAGAPPALDTLDRLVLRERLTLQGAQQTRDIEGWIRAGAAPEALAARGVLIEKKRKAAGELVEAKKQLCKSPCRRARGTISPNSRR